MGTWGNGIFADDTACDVRDEYQALLAELQDVQAATDALLKKWKSSLDDDDEGPLVWLALAVTQHKLGRLEERVRREALRVIDDGRGLERWRDEGARAVAKRQAVLAKTRDLLASPQPPPRKIRPPFRDSCKWDVGELIAYRLALGRHIVLRVVAHEMHPHGVAPVCELLDWIGDAPPGADSLRERGVRSATLSTWSLFQFLSNTVAAPASTSSEQATSQPLGVNGVLAELGLIDAAAARYGLADVLNPAGGPPEGFDWQAHFLRIEKAIERVRRDDKAIAQKIREVAQRHSPKLLNPVSQLSIRRQPGIETLPLRRLKRLKAKLPASPPDNWIAVRWPELDAFVKDIFGIT
ncbi:MAG: hypothetical protein U1D55_02300 [Phycisphaerae bacterium]